MMIIDIRKLNAQKKYVGEMEFEYSAPNSLIEIPFVEFSSPILVSFTYELYEDDSLEIRGSVAYTLKGQCSRCLKEATMRVEGEIDAYFEARKDYEDYGYTNGIIDLKKAVDDAVMASMPFLLTCSDVCGEIAYPMETEI